MFQPIDLLDLLKGGLTLKLFQKRNLLFVIKREGGERESVSVSEWDGEEGEREMNERTTDQRNKNTIILITDLCEWYISSMTTSV